MSAENKKLTSDAGWSKTGVPFSTESEGVDYILKAKTLVQDLYNRKYFDFEKGGRALQKYDIYVVTFSYVLGGWKAFISTKMPDGRYYEVTYDARHRRTYIDVYAKVDQETDI